ncbi:ATP-grasp domain-containing protein [Aureivirga marina]|uniref:hypothetical protein n=1 Tax=Aureivirga marina TaxID=1182451 RepID=UPI0018C9887D|nr:hypothetical protein [Aureivirga marina]
MKQPIQIIKPNSFEAENHWYPKALNATIHPMVHFFLNLDVERMINRYCHLNPSVNREKLKDILNYKTKYYHWCGADLINVTSKNGTRKMVVIENNSCPSGQKSMPLQFENQEEGGYKHLIDNAFAPFMKCKRGCQKVEGKLAVFYDKNPMEASGYAHAIANRFNEEVFYIPFYNDERHDKIRYINDQFFVYHQKAWQPIRGVFRYLTKKPWNRLPIRSKTKIFNPIITCLSGGRNKTTAAKAYDMYNAEIHRTGLKINTPETIWDVNKEEIPLWVKRFGGQAVVKVPYMNAGQGVFPILSQEQLETFMAKDFTYDRFIVQSLIGNFNWGTSKEANKLFHVGTIPNSHGNAYVTDIRFMTSSTANGIRPIAIYARRAQKPLKNEIPSENESWDVLGTNLSIKLGENQWTSDTSRLLLPDRRDFNKLGLGLDDLIEAYIQTTLSMIAIDKMCKNLISPKGVLKKRLFKSLNDDSKLINEIFE